jgi:hypothetical protein
MKNLLFLSLFICATASAQKMQNEAESAVTVQLAEKSHVSSFMDDKSALKAMTNLSGKEIDISKAALSAKTTLGVLTSTNPAVYMMFGSAGYVSNQHIGIDPAGVMQIVMANVPKGMYAVEMNMQADDPNGIITVATAGKAPKDQQKIMVSNGKLLFLIDLEKGNETIYIRNQSKTGMLNYYNAQISKVN